MRGQSGSAARKPPQQPKNEQTKPDAKGNGAEKPAHIEITAQTAIAAESLKGDVRDAILQMVKGLAKPWAKMTEWEQESAIRQCADIAGKLVHETVRITASRGFDHIPVSLGTFTVDAEKGIQSKFAMARTPDNLVAMGERLGSIVLLIPMDVHEFMGEKKPAEADVVGDLAMPKGEAPVAGHTITMSVDDSTDPKMAVASCECGWSSKLDVAEAAKQAPLIAAHLEQARAQAKVGRGPVDAKGNPLKPDADGVVDKTKTEKTGEASQAMPGDIGPATPPAPSEQQQPEA